MPAPRAPRRRRRAGRAPRPRLKNSSAAGWRFPAGRSRSAHRRSPARAAGRRRTPRARAACGEAPAARAPLHDLDRHEHDAERDHRLDRVRRQADDAERCRASVMLCATVNAVTVAISDARNPPAASARAQTADGRNPSGCARCRAEVGCRDGCPARRVLDGRGGCRRCETDGPGRAVAERCRRTRTSVTIRPPTGPSRSPLAILSATPEHGARPACGYRERARFQIPRSARGSGPMRIALRHPRAGLHAPTRRRRRWRWANDGGSSRRCQQIEPHGRELRPRHPRRGDRGSDTPA